MRRKTMEGVGRGVAEDLCEYIGCGMERGR